jgi:hypothetical protein
VVRPGSWSRPADGSPVRVDTGVPGSRPRFVPERRRAERGAESLCGGSKHAGRSVKRTLRPRVYRPAPARRVDVPKPQGGTRPPPPARPGQLLPHRARRQADWYVVHRLRGLMIKKRGWNLRHDRILAWDEDRFNGHGLYRLRGTVRYPKAA